MQAIPHVSEPLHKSFAIQPNASLSPRQAGLAFASLVAASLLLALPLALMGYWPILLFAALELLAVIAALRFCIRSGARLEVIRISTDTVTVEKGHGGPQQRWSFSVYWTRIILTTPLYGGHSRRLLIRCLNQEVEVGDCLIAKDKEKLASRLKEIIGPVGTAPRRDIPGSQSAPDHDLPMPVASACGVSDAGKILNER